MRAIKTKIPNNENKSNYMLVHKDTYIGIIEYLGEIHDRERGEGLDALVHGIYNELEGLRRL